MDPSCPFCSPTDDQLFHEGQLVRGIWDAFPVTPGHALLITRRHVSSWFEASREEQAELLEAAEVARTEIEERFGAEAFNLGVNVGAAAGQTVQHLHVHVIPRRPGDVSDPRGGVRHVIPEKGNYLLPADTGQEVQEGGTSAGREEQRAHVTPSVVGGIDDPFLPHLVAHLDRASHADLLVAFVLDSGVAAVENALRSFLLRGGILRLLTGDYLGATDPRALFRLLDLESYAQEDGQLQLRVFESASGSFHPKAYLFRFEGDAGGWAARDGVAYVGSSNLSRTALQHGVEWNYRVVLARNEEGFAEVVRSFEALFQNPRTRLLDVPWIEDYAKRRPQVFRVSPEVPEEPLLPPPEPHTIQQEALSALESTRSDGNSAGMVVMATGLGKTWLAAFDVARMRSQRVLFVAHREEILRQALSTFRRILPEARLGMYSGQQRDTDADVLFASVQSLGRRDHLRHFATSAFDYIVVDEFHHASARTYRQLIEHFRPQFLLGLTATPERTDGGNLLALCEDNLVYRCDLFEALRRAPDRLVPFHYFGVPDAVDYQNIPWRNRRFDPAELESALATGARAENALDQWRRRAGTRTLGFCCSMAHADFMARYFVEAGVEAVAVHSGASSAPRATSLDRLAAGKIAVVFAVDILNEGVDIPDVDTVLMLRPTESRIVFLQQLGRGLRAAAGKDHLTVIDYIGNHRSFKLKPQILLQLGPGDATLRAALQCLQLQTSGAHELPPGCEVTYELEAIRLLEGQLASPDAADALYSWYREFEERVGVRPLALNALHEGRNPRSVRPAHGSWLRFVAACGGVSEDMRALIGTDSLAGAFLEELERTRMSRSFKMVVVLAMLRGGDFPRSISIADLASGFRDVAGRRARLRADVMPDMDDDRALQEYLTTNPINAWCNAQSGGRPYFSFDAGIFRPLFSVPDELAVEYRAITRELAEWRLADHLAGRPAQLATGWRIIAKVLQSNGRPILKLPSRDKYEGIPEGDVAVRVDGRDLVARFVKEYVNVIGDASRESNELPGLMQNWFGDQAGQPGTLFFVSFTRTGEAWDLAPLAPGQASRAIVEHAVERRPESKVVTAAGEEIDATYHVEAAEGQLSVVFHSRGGTGGTPNAINTEYAEGLEILLQRLKDEEALLDAIYLDTLQTRDASLDERLLRLRGGRDYPVAPAQEQDIGELRRAISSAQGNNPTRRIRLVLRLPGTSNLEALARTLGTSRN